MSPTSTPARSIACFDATTARSTGERSLSFPPKVPKGVRTAERKTTLSPLAIGAVVFTLEGRLFSAVDAELPDRIELRPATGAVLGSEVLTTVRAIRSEE